MFDVPARLYETQYQIHRVISIRVHPFWGSNMFRSRNVDFLLVIFTVMMYYYLLMDDRKAHPE